jgi:hypothetical protein
MDKAIIGLSLFMSLGCAGPTSPFGNLDYESVGLKATTKQNKELDQKSFGSEKIETGVNSILRIYPKQQVLHKKYPLKLTIYDPDGVADEPTIKVFYNHLDITKKYLKKISKQRVSDNQMVLTFEGVKISPTRTTQLYFSYLGKRHGQRTHLSYQQPNCEWSSKNNVQNTGQFAVSPELKTLIETLAQAENINPALIAGLIAQESGFNPKAVSISKGIGLTQITPVAEDEVLQIFPDLPRFPSLNDMHPLRIKALISLDKITEHQEWRLNPTYSIRGGVAYLNVLKNYWGSFEKAREIASLISPQKLESEQVKLILASYNSGFVRVRGELSTHKDDWMKSGELNEAKKYVNLVSSYCSLFSQREE